MGVRIMQQSMEGEGMAGMEEWREDVVVPIKKKTGEDCEGL